MTNVHGIKVAGATFPAEIWHDYMAVAKGGFCATFPKPVERPELKPFCGRLAATRKCELPPVRHEDGDGADGTAVPYEADTAPAAPPPPVPDTAIVGGPPSETTARSATFSFSAQVVRAKGFECSVDSGPLTRCTSPVRFVGLRPGTHTFTVRALSPAGDPDATPATRTWNVFDDLVPRAPEKEKPKPKPKQPARDEGPPELIG
jgi:hypothetical protein